MTTGRCAVWVISERLCGRYCTVNQSSPVRITNEPAFVLRTRSYRESSLLVDVFTENQGRIRLIAKGARGGRTAVATRLQVFHELRLSWQGKSELKTLTAVDSLRCLLRRSDSLVAGMYLNELIYLLLGEADPHPVLFRHYRTALGEIEVDDALEPHLRQFELSLLGELGYGLQFREDVEGQPILPELAYQYIREVGFQVVGEGVEGAFPGAVLVELATAGPVSASALRAAKVLCRASIDLLLDGRQLKSREWHRPPIPTAHAGAHR